jgi:tripartite-type tricarboxylate transporter receptor subunit TctC
VARHLCISILLAGHCLLPAGAASAQALPPGMQIIIPFAPAGPVDFTARVLADRLRAQLGIPVVADNRAGANGAVAAVAVKNAAPDGRMLLFFSSGMLTISPHLEKNLPYDALRDFALVTSGANIGGVLVVGPKVAAGNMQEFVALARASRAPLAFGSPGKGNPSDMNIYNLQDAAKIDLLHVYYKGAGPVLTDVLSGQIAGAFTGLSTAMPFIQSGRLKALGFIGKRRSELAPDIPTFEEQGYAGIDIQAWMGIMAPAAMRAETVTALADAVANAVKQEDTRARLHAGDMTPWVVRGDELLKVIREQSAHWKKLIAERNITAE